MSFEQVLSHIHVKEKVLLFGALLFNGMYIWVDRATISFTLGVVVSILAIVNYILQIRKNLNEKK